MRKEFETLKTDRPAPHVLRVTLNRPEASNAFNTQMAKDLIDCFEAVAMDAAIARAIILTGAGDRAFCAGGDLKERLDMTDEAWGRQHLVYERMARAVIACPTPVIAVVGNDACWAQIAREQVEILRDDVGCRLRRTDYHAVAEGFGGRGLRVDAPDDLRSCLEDAVRISREGQPVLVNALLGRTDFRKGSISM